jgi:hypothetical protein
MEQAGALESGEVRTLLPRKVAEAGIALSANAIGETAAAAKRM